MLPQQQGGLASALFSKTQRRVLGLLFGNADVTREALATLGDDVHYAFIYGSIAKGADTARSDIDVMIVGTGLSYSDAVDMLGEVEPRLGRPVNPTLYSPPEFRRKLADDSAFLKRLLAQPKIFLIGSEGDLPQS